MILVTAGLTGAGILLALIYTGRSLGREQCKLGLN
jgi:hypothetical protein